MNTQIVINNLRSVSNPGCVIFKNGKVVYPQNSFLNLANLTFGEIYLENEGPVFLSEEKKWLPSLPGQAEGNITDVTDVCGRGYRGHQFFASYTKEQLDSLTLELRKLVNHFNIEIDRKSFDYHCNNNDNNSIWYCNIRAAESRSGIYTPNSFFKSFQGIAPLYQLINALKSI